MQVLYGCDEFKTISLASEDDLLGRRMNGLT
jgi:hypothetical protein